MQKSSLVNNEYVQMSVESGVAPLELKFYPFVECDSGLPIAYRTKTTIHSVKLGDLAEDDYTYVSDKRECGVELLKHNIQHAITAINKFIAAGRNVKFVSVRCPSELVETADLYEIFSEVIQKNPSLKPEMLCLEFPASLIMEQKSDKARTGVLDMKLLNIRTALVGCGTEDFPISKLLAVTPDIVILAPEATAWVGSRDKPRLFSSLVSYVNSMDIEVIAEGTEEQRKSMRGSDCSGFFVTDCEPLTLDEAVAQKEDAE